MNNRLAKATEDDHKKFVGGSLMIARTALNKRPVDWTKKYPTLLTTQSKLANYEAGKHYPPPLFLVRLCEDYGLTMDWFYRRVRSGVPEQLSDKLRGTSESASQVG